MAEQRRTSYPSIPSKNWWDLRRQLNRTPSATVTPPYLATVLNISEASARNLVPPLLATGIIDENGRLTQLGNEWRHDEQYADACHRIAESVYPDELRHALPCPDPDRRSVENWFSRRTGSGEAAVNKMASFYLLLCQADPAPAEAGRTSRADGRGRAPREQARPTRRRAAGQPARTEPARVGEPSVPAAPEQPASQPRDGARVTVSRRPSLHVDVQIHIPADATADQIDQIFASMARHLGLSETSGT
jgi:Family of unknown function (DUF5343)